MALLNIQNLMRPRVKICGITNIEDALSAIEVGADALGFVFYPKSPRYITPELAQTIVQQLPAFVNTVGLFMDGDEAFVTNVMDGVALDTFQFHGNEPPEFCEYLAKQYNKPYIKAVPMHADLDVVKYCESFTGCRAVLLDSNNFGEMGGSGKTFDWNDIPTLTKPVILAGGLTPNNIADAIEQGVKKAGCYALDLSSGVEREDEQGKRIAGQKDAQKMRALMQAIDAIYLKQFKTDTLFKSKDSQ